MARERVLDLARVHVVAAGDDQLLARPDDAQVAVAVELAEVAGAEPAVGGEGLGVGVGPLPVAAEHVRAPQQHLDSSPLGQAQLDAGQREADRARPALAVVGVGDEHARSRSCRSARATRWPVPSASARQQRRRAAAPSPRRTGAAGASSAARGESARRGTSSAPRRTAWRRWSRAASSTASASKRGQQHGRGARPAACRGARRRGRACGTAAGTARGGRRAPAPGEAQRLGAGEQVGVGQHAPPSGRRSCPRCSRSARGRRGRQRRAAARAPSGRAMSGPRTSRSPPAAPPRPSGAGPGRRRRRRRPGVADEVGELGSAVGGVGRDHHQPERAGRQVGDDQVGEAPRREHPVARREPGGRQPQRHRARALLELPAREPARHRRRGAGASSAARASAG